MHNGIMFGMKRQFPGESGRGLPQSKTLREMGTRSRSRASVLECARPLALFRKNAASPREFYGKGHSPAPLAPSSAFRPPSSALCPPPSALRPLASGVLAAVLVCAFPAAGGQALRGWLSWRGPEQTGVSRETGLPDKVSAQEPLWVADYPGQSAPVLANGRLYAMGYSGQGRDLREGVTCFDAETGQKLWEQLYNDYLSDTIYLRYATGSPVIDPETGAVYMQGTQGILAGFTPDGNRLWQHSLMEEFGRLTFPNGRTATPAINGDLVITRGITANWGTQGPAADRFYAFDKRTGGLVWASSPGALPRTIRSLIPSSAGIRASASSMRPWVTAALPASMPALANRCGA